MGGPGRRRGGENLERPELLLPAFFLRALRPPSAPPQLRRRCDLGPRKPGGGGGGVPSRPGRGEAERCRSEPSGAAGRRGLQWLRGGGHRGAGVASAPARATPRIGMERESVGL